MTVESAQLKRILTFNQVGLKIQEELNVEDIYHVIGEGLKEIGLHCGIMLFDNEQKYLILEHMSSSRSLVSKVEKLLGVKAAGFKMPVETDVAVMTAVRERRAVYTTEGANIIKEMLPSIRHVPLLNQAAKMLGLSHVIAAPLVARGQVFGALAVYSRNIPEEEIPIVVAFANQAAIAIDNVTRLPLEFESKAKKIEESEKKYRQLLEGMKDGYAVIQDAKVVFANMRLEEIFRYEQGQMIGLDITELIAPENLQQIMEIYMNVVKGKEKEPERLEVIAIKRDGTTFPIQAGVKPIQYEGQFSFSIIVTDITERKLAQEALKRSQQQFQALTENAFDTIVVVKADQTISYVSPSVKRSLGYEPEEFMGKSLFEQSHPDELQKAIDTFAEVMQYPENTVFMEFQTKHKDGSWRTIEGVATNLMDNPAVEGIVINFSDITERKQVEEALQRSEEHYRSLIENSYDVIIVEEADGTIRYTSHSVEQVLGYKPDELIGRNSFDLIHPDERQHIINNFIKSVNVPGPIGTMIIKLLHKDGSWRTVEGTGTNLLFHPAVEGIVTNFHDVTDRIQAEEALRESEKDYRVLFDNTLDGVFVIDAETMKVVLGNQATATLYGFDSVEEAIGVNPLEFIPPEDREQVLRIIVEDMFIKDLREVCEFRTITKDGREIWVSAIGTRTEYQGRLAGLVSIRDITVQKQAEELLQRSEEHFRLLIDNTYDVIAVLGADGNISYTSPSVERVLGYKPEELAEKQAFDFLHPDDILPIADSFGKVIQTPGYTDSMEMRARHKDGSWRVVQGIGVSLLNEPSVAGIIINFRDVTDHKQTEEKFRQLLEEMNDGYIVINNRGEIVFANSKFADIFGYNPEQVPGRPLSDFVSSDRSRTVMEEYGRVISGEDKTPEQRESVGIKKDGSVIIVESNVKSIEYEEKPAYSVIVRDITERKKTEEKFRQLLEEMNDGYVVIQDGQYVFANRRYCEMLGYEPEEVIGMAPFIHTTPSDRQAMIEQYEKVMSGNELPAKRFESITISKDGRQVIIESNISTIEYEGKPAFGAILRDITERKQAEEALRRSEEHFRLLTENITDVIVVLAADGTINYTSPSAARVIGYTPEEVIDKQAYIYIHPEDLPAFIGAISKGIQTPGYSESMEMRLHHKDGSWRYVEGTGINLLYEPSVAGIVLNYRDITERKQTEAIIKDYYHNLEKTVKERTQELKDAQDKIVRSEKLAAIGELAGSMAHELRNPLGAVKASTHFLRMKMKDTIDEKLIKHLDILEKQADVCNNIISDLLDFSRPAKLEIRTVDIDQVIGEVVQNIEIPQNIEVSTSFARDLATMMADKGHLERVFTNLVINSIEAMPDGGKLSLSANQNDGLVEVTVVDTGMGIPEENLINIFEPLFTTKAKGVGLGLSLAKALIEKQKGTIDVESQVGKGTAFKIKLPVVSHE